MFKGTKVFNIRIPARVFKIRTLSLSLSLRIRSLGELHFRCEPRGRIEGPEEQIEVAFAVVAVLVVVVVAMGVSNTLRHVIARDPVIAACVLLSAIGTFLSFSPFSLSFLFLFNRNLKLRPQTQTMCLDLHMHNPCVRVCGNKVY